LPRWLGIFTLRNTSAPTICHHSVKRHIDHQDAALRTYAASVVVGVNKIKSERNLKQTREALGQQNYLSSQARKFKKHSASEAEEFLWSLLRESRLGVSFQRQKVLYGYIVDFWCPSSKIAVELDGRQHSSRRDKDAARDQILLEHGVRVFAN
jgi:very-short-patch-repair endonuclease